MTTPTPTTTMMMTTKTSTTKMMTSLVKSAVVMTTLLMMPSRAYPGGAPRDACRSLFPHHGADSQTSAPPPYSVTLDTNIYSPGSGQAPPITVTLRGRGRAAFKGVMLQARSVGSCNETVGTFRLDPRSAHLLRLQDCRRPHDTVTHTDNTSKTAVSFLWVPPATGMGHVYIRATVVQAGSVFWNTVRSPILYQGSNDATTAVTCRAPTTLEAALTLDAGDPDHDLDPGNDDAQEGDADDDDGPHNGGSFVSRSYVIVLFSALFYLPAL